MFCLLTLRCAPNAGECALYLYLVTGLQVPLKVSDLLSQPLALALQVAHLQHGKVTAQNQEAMIQTVLSKQPAAEPILRLFGSKSEDGYGE